MNTRPHYILKNRPRCIGPPHKTQYDEFLLCAIDLHSDESGLQAVYKLNSADLVGTNYVVVGSKTPYIPLERDQLQTAIQGLVSKVIDHHAPWLQAIKH